MATHKFENVGCDLYLRSASTLSLALVPPGNLCAPTIITLLGDTELWTYHNRPKTNPTLHPIKYAILNSTLHSNPRVTMLSPLKAASDSVDDKVRISYGSKYWTSLLAKNGAAIQQIATLLGKISNFGAAALKRLSEPGKIYNCSTWTFLMTILLDPKFRKLIRLATPQIIGLLGPGESHTHKSAVGALSRLAEQGKISYFLTWGPFIDVLVAEFQESIHPRDHYLPQWQRVVCS